MGLLKKIFKGVKKVVKKIGKGIKKVVGKVGKIFGKLGIVGQLALNFLLPGIGGFLSTLGGLGGKALAWVGKAASGWAGTLMKSSNIGARFLGKAINVLHTVGSLPGKAMGFVTDQISNAFDWVTTKAGDKWEGFGDMWKKSGEQGKEIVGPPKSLMEKDTSKGFGSRIKDAFRDDPADKDDWYFGKKMEGLQTKIADTKENIFGTSEDTTVVSTDQQQVDTKVDTKAIETPSFWDEAKDYAKSGVLSGVKSRVASAVAGDPKTQGVVHYTIPNLIGAFASRAANVFDQVDLTFQQNGNSWMGANLAGYDATKAYYDDGTEEYRNSMRGIERQVVSDSYVGG